MEGSITWGLVRVDLVGPFRQPRIECYGTALEADKCLGFIVSRALLCVRLRMHLTGTLLFWCPAPAVSIMGAHVSTERDSR
ncbi:hypothetical protein VTI28DRAFT_3147 [Corynascus sepedonium]